jgi:hypothetical protein
MRILGLAFLLLLIPFSVSAKALLQELSFERGDWAMVAVPLHNYHLLPVQQELGTFITRDKSFLRDLQDRWDFESTYDDDCDYHYALKFYQGKNLVKTLMINLYCGYITMDGLSYEFNPDEFQLFKKHAKSVAWSRISFANMDILKEAIYTLEDAANVYWYEDVKQYQYDGFFMLNLNNLPWTTNLDSLSNAVDNAIINKTGGNEFYLQKYFHQIYGNKMSVRYLVNCDEHTGQMLSSYAVIPWRSHLHSQDSVRVVAIGVDKKKYKKLMRRN